MGWAGHVACVGQKKNNGYRILVEEPEYKTPRGKLRCRLEDNIEMDLKEIGLDVVDWIHMA